MMSVDVTFCLSFIKDIVQILFYFTATIIAIFGLNMWRRQLRGTSEYNVAKNVLVNAYKIRDSIKNCQSPWMYPSEWADRVRKENESKEDQQILDTYHGYLKRFNKVIDERNSLYASQIEAEAIFGNHAKDVIDSLHKIIHRLKVAIDLYHQYRLQKVGEKKILKQFFNIINGINKIDNPTLENDLADDDHFKITLDEAIKNIESYFKPKVKKKYK